MTADQALDRFLGAISQHPDTAVMGAMLQPYRAMASEPEQLVRTLDLLAGMWERAKIGERS